jgi:hypothetical protein
LGSFNEGIERSRDVRRGRREERVAVKLETEEVRESGRARFREREPRAMPVA